MSVLNRFNWIARSYDKLVELVFGNTLHLAQSYFISAIGGNDKILILGGGTGKFLDTLLRQRPAVSVTYIEASSEMIALARKQVDNNPRVTFIHGTHDTIPDELFDVVITSFFLDLFRENSIDQMVNTISKKLRPGGKWIVTDFENTQKLSDRFLLSLMYIGFTITGSIDAKRLPIWRPVFAKEGLKFKAEKFFRDGFVGTSVFSKE